MQQCFSKEILHGLKRGPDEEQPVKIVQLGHNGYDTGCFYCTPDRVEAWVKALDLRKNTRTLRNEASLSLLDFEEMARDLILGDVLDVVIEMLGETKLPRFDWIGTIGFHQHGDGGELKSGTMRDGGMNKIYGHSSEMMQRAAKRR